MRSNLPLVPAPSVPEICLHTAGPESGLWRLAEQDEDFAAPYWAYTWGGGLALARHVLDHPQTVAGRAVLDLGAGSGIVAIAAAKAGARSAIAADIDPYAIMATGLNAAANGVTVSTYLGDLTGGAPPDVETILVGDLFYEASLADRVTDFLDRCIRFDNIQVLVGDPWRSALPRTRLRLLAEYPGPDFGDGGRGAQSHNAVFAFEAAPRGWSGAVRSRAGRGPLRGGGAIAPADALPTPRRRVRAAIRADRGPPSRQAGPASRLLP